MTWLYAGIAAAGAAMKIGSAFTKDKGTKQGLDLGGSALMMGGSFGMGGGFGGGTSSGAGIGSMGNRFAGMPGAGGSGGGMIDMLGQGAQALGPLLQGGGGGQQPAGAPVQAPDPLQPAGPIIMGGMPEAEQPMDRQSRLRRNMMMQPYTDPLMRR